MLERSFKTALPLSLKLTEQYKTVYPFSGTPLADLVNLSVVPGVQGQLDTTLPDEFESALNMYAMDLGMATSSSLPNSRWPATFDAMVMDVRKIVGNHISYIRNTIVPVVMEFTNKGNEAIAQLGSWDPSSDLEIKVEKIPEILQDETFLSLLAPFVGRGVIRPTSASLRLPIDAPEDWATAVSTGSNRLDDLVTIWRQGLPVDFVKSAWVSFVADSSKIGGIEAPSIDSFENANPYYVVDMALSYFLVINSLIANPPNANISESTESFNRRLREHELYAGTVLVSALQRIQSLQQDEVLIVRIDPNKRSISVNGELYGRWVDTGGSADIILGILVSNRPVYTLHRIAEEVENLKKTWENYCVVGKQNLEFNKASTLRLVYSDLFSTLAMNKDEQELALDAAGGDNASARLRGMQAQVRTALDKMSKEDLLNVESVARRLIAGIRFSHTAAEEFLGTMVAVGRDNPNVDEGQAAFIATLNYVTDYLRTMIGVQKL